MKRGWIIAAMTVLGTAAASAQVTLKTDDDKTLYLLGASLGQRIADLGLRKQDMEFVKLGLEDVAGGGKPQVDPEVYNPKLVKFIEGRVAAKVQAEKDRAKPFLEKAAKEKGAVRLPSGLVYTVLKKGAGTSPKLTDHIKAHYHGTYIDGKVFESSVERGEPVSFPQTVGELIPCWKEGIPLIKVGGKIKLVCPSPIAYGDRGNSRIPGGATLVFEIELLDILKPETAGPKEPKKP